MSEKSKWVKGASFLLEEVSTEDVFTPEQLTEEHHLIQNMVEEFVAKEVMPVVLDIEQHQFDHTVRLLKKAGELGLLSADIPENYGGLGLDKVSSSIISEELAKAGAFGLSHGAHVGIGTLPIVYFGTHEQKERYLPKLATGEMIAAYALTEPGSGSDALGARTKAVLNEEGTHYVLNGEKQWITNAGFADLFVVYAKINGDQFTAFLVEKDIDGVSVGAEEKKMGIKGSSTRTLILEDAKVPVDHVLGEIGRGHVIAFNILNIGRYKLGIGCVGSGKRALKLAIDWAKERKQFKTPIIQFKLIQEKLANMAIALYVAESVGYRTGGLFEQRLSQLNELETNGEQKAKAIAEYAIECSITKVAGSEMLDYVVDEAVQIHGGYGFMSEYEVERLYRDSRINRIFEGTNEINRLLIPGTILRKTLKGELPLMEKAQALQKELLLQRPTPKREEPLFQEQEMIEQSKKLFLLVAGTAVQTYGGKLEREQEVLANVADIVIDVYQMESAYLRAKKEMERVGNEQAKPFIQMTEVFCQEAFERITSHAKETVCAVQTGDGLRTMLALVKKLTKTEPRNVIALKREITAHLLTKKNQ